MDCLEHARNTDVLKRSAASDSDRKGELRNRE